MYKKNIALMLGLSVACNLMCSSSSRSVLKPEEEKPYIYAALEELKDPASIPSDRLIELYARYKNKERGAYTILELISNGLIAYGQTYVPETAAAAQYISERDLDTLYEQARQGKLASISPVTLATLIYTSVYSRDADYDTLLSMENILNTAVGYKQRFNHHYVYPLKRFSPPTRDENDKENKKPSNIDKKVGLRERVRTILQRTK